MDKPKVVQVTLSPSLWTAQNDSFIQEIAIEGISEDEEAQFIEITPVYESSIIEAIYDYEVQAISHGLNKIIFEAYQIPNIDIKFNISIIDLV